MASESMPIKKEAETASDPASTKRKVEDTTDEADTVIIDVREAKVEKGEAAVKRSRSDDDSDDLDDSTSESDSDDEEDDSDDEEEDKDETGKRKSAEDSSGDDGDQEMKHEGGPTELQLKELQRLITKGRFVSDKLHASIAEMRKAYPAVKSVFRSCERLDCRDQVGFFTVVIRGFLSKHGVTSNIKKMEDLFERVEKAFVDWLELIKDRCNVALVLRNALKQWAPINSERLATDLMKTCVPKDVKDAMSQWPMRAARYMSFLKSLYGTYLGWDIDGEDRQIVDELLASAPINANAVYSRFVERMNELCDNAFYQMRRDIEMIIETEPMKLHESML